MPFWGNHCLIDFQVASLPPSAQIAVVLEDYARDAALALSSRWRRPSIQVRNLDDGLADMAALVSGAESELVIIASLSSVSVLEPGALADTAAAAGDQIVKVSIGRTPIELYCGRREHFTSVLESAAARDSGSASLRERLFTAALHPAIDLIEDLPGEILFQNDLMEYYRNNIWVVANSESERLHRTLMRLPELSDRGDESHVAERGSIRNSWLASGVEVEGSVDGSILFPGVVVRRGAVVHNSVVTSGNRIGPQAELQSTLVLPFTAEQPRNASNIGEGCVIGSRTSSARNGDFPEHIRDGLTVLGMNASIPNGFRAEAGSFVAPGVNPGTLKRLKVLKRGASVLVGDGAASDGRGDDR